MAVSDADGIVYYRYIYDTYGELSDITTDDGVSLKSSEQLTEYRLAELAHATGIDYLYNGQYGVETDQNGLYYMRARYYDQDIKRFINRDVVSGDIGNSQSLNRYCYVQGNPVSLTDPFGLCPDPNSNFKNFCKFLYYTDWSAIGHAALDVAGLFWDGADVINALWYALEGNPEMAIASAIFAIPGAGIGIGNLMMKSEKLASAGKAVRAVSKFTQSAIGVGAGMSIATVGYQNLRHSIEAGEFSLTDLATFIGGLTIAAISGKGLISSGKDFASLFDDVGKTSKAGKGQASIDNRLVTNDFSDRGTRIATTKQIRSYKKQMKSMGINVVVDRKGKMLNGTRVAGFDYSTGTIYIRKNAGVLDLYHEGYHAEQYLSIGQKNYIELGRLAREEYVYSRIMDNHSLFNEAEIQSATKYIERLRRGN